MPVFYTSYFMRNHLWAVALAAFILVSCSKDDSGTLDEIRINYAEIVHTNYQDVLSKAVVMDEKIDLFLANPSASALDDARNAWMDARYLYGQTEVFRFYGGPIDDADGPEGLMNAWPLDEVYIDQIIADTTGVPVITAAAVSALNEQGGETNISTGWHAIEYLLWGQDMNVSAPGNRPYTDYTTAPFHARRSEYLGVISDLLVQHLQSLVNEWSSGPANFRQEFLNGSTQQSLTWIMQGMGFLAKGELAGERLSVAYDTQLQEDEHSCFSDNTHNDIRANMQGIYNVYFGSYLPLSGVSINGTSISSLLHTKDHLLAEEIDLLMEQCKESCNAIQAPFDQEILASNTQGRARVYEAIERLRSLGDKLSEAAGLLNISIQVE